MRHRQLLNADLRIAGASARPRAMPASASALHDSLERLSLLGRLLDLVPLEMAGLGHGEIIHIGIRRPLDNQLTDAFASGLLDEDLDDLDLSSLRFLVVHLSSRLLLIGAIRP